MYNVFVTFHNEMPTKAEIKKYKLKSGQTVTRKVKYTYATEKLADEWCLYRRQGGHPAYVEKA